MRGARGRILGYIEERRCHTGAILTFAFNCILSLNPYILNSNSLIIMSSFLDKVKDVAGKASDAYQENKSKSSGSNNNEDGGTYDSSKNDDYSSGNQQSSSEVSWFEIMGHHSPAVGYPR